MRFVRSIFLLFMFSSFSGWAQALPADNIETIKPTKYLLKAKGPSGEVISTTGRIVKAIALSRPQSLEIARIYLNYTATIKLNTDVSGETSAIVSFHAMKLTGDVIYKGFDIEDQIFPSLVSFRLILPSKVKGPKVAKQVLATVRAANVNSGDCSISISLHKNVTEIPVIDLLAFYHSDNDFENADNQMRLIDRYFAAGWLMQQTDNLFDAMQHNQLHDPAAFLASNLEVIVLNDWIIRQHFNQYPVFQKNDSLSLAKRLVINRFKNKLIDQDFVKLNVIRNEDLLKAANLFAVNLANYFDTNQPDLIRATYLSQMAGGRLSSIGYKAILDFAQIYSAAHKHYQVDWRLFVKASSLIRHAMTIQASELADQEQFSEAMGLLNASDNYDLQKGNSRSPADSILIRKLSQRLYNVYLDIALKSLNVEIYRVTNDYYQKAVQLKQSFGGMITSDYRERYVADMICKAMLLSAEKSIKGNDVVSALSTFEQVIRLADFARLKNAYKTANSRLETISNRPSGFKPWEGVDLAIIVPAKETVNAKAKAKEKVLTLSERYRPKGKYSTFIAPVKIKEVAIAKTKKDSISDWKNKKQMLTKSQVKDSKDNVFLVAIIKRLSANKIKQASKDSMALADIDKRISINKSNSNGKVSQATLETMRKQIITTNAIRYSKDSILLEANKKNFKAIQLRMSGYDKKMLLTTHQKGSILDENIQKIKDTSIVIATSVRFSVPQKSALPIKKQKLKKESLPADSVETGVEKKVKSFSIPEIDQQISENIKRVHLKIWSGDTISSAELLNKTDSLQNILVLAGEKGFAVDLRALRMNYEEMRCEQQKKAYLHELDQIRSLLKLNDFSLAVTQLNILIARPFTTSCKVDKSEAIRLLSTLEVPLVYTRWIIQLDSIAKTQEPEAIIEAFEKASAYYHDNMLDKLGLEPPDMMVALKSRNETSFLLKAIEQMLYTHRPTNALELLKEIQKLEPKPDKTFSVQKRIGEMLASGDHTVERKVNDMLIAYNLNSKWYNELIVAYKKQWKLFVK